MYISYVFFLFHKFCINSHSCERVCRLQIKMFLLYFTLLYLDHPVGRLRACLVVLILNQTLLSS